MTFSTYELQAEYQLCGLPGESHGGVWYHSDRWDDLAAGSTQVFRGNHGIHAEIQQMLTKERRGDEEDLQGLWAFAQYGWSPEDRNVANHYIGFGLVYPGLLQCRDDDVLGAGVAHVIFSDRLADATYETAIELFYKAQLSPYVMLQPDLQFIANPGGDGRDAFVFGLRFEVVL